jgi:hypothetical protein
MTLCIWGLYVTLSISDTQHKQHSAQQCSAIMRSVISLSVTFYYHYAESCYAECRYDECRYAECRYDYCRSAK